MRAGVRAEAMVEEGVEVRTRVREAEREAGGVELEGEGDGSSAAHRASCITSSRLRSANISDTPGLPPPDGPRTLLAMIMELRV